MDNIANVHLNQSNDLQNNKDEVQLSQSPQNMYNCNISVDRDEYSHEIVHESNLSPLIPDPNESASVPSEADEYLCGFSMSDFLETCSQNEGLNIPNSNYQ